MGTINPWPTSKHRNAKTTLRVCPKEWTVALNGLCLVNVHDCDWNGMCLYNHSYWFDHLLLTIESCFCKRWIRPKIAGEFRISDRGLIEQVPRMITDRSCRDGDISVLMDHCVTLKQKNLPYSTILFFTHTIPLITKLVSCWPPQLDLFHRASHARRLDADGIAHVLASWMYHKSNLLLEWLCQVLLGAGGHSCYASRRCSSPTVCSSPLDSSAHLGLFRGLCGWYDAVAGGPGHLQRLSRRVTADATVIKAVELLTAVGCWQVPTHTSTPPPATIVHGGNISSGLTG